MAGNNNNEKMKAVVKPLQRVSLTLMWKKNIAKPCGVHTSRFMPQSLRFFSLGKKQPHLTPDSTNSVVPTDF